MIGRLSTERLVEARRRAMQSGRWPRTERRQRRIDQVLALRQPDLTLVIEDVYDIHNVSAVLRSADATGVLQVHTVYNQGEPPEEAYARTTSASAAKWVEVIRHGSISDCYAQLRASGHAILATALAPGAASLYEADFLRPTAIVLGNELHGVSDEALVNADAVIEIPMRGMVQSLNVSVAASVALYEALRQREAAGMFRSPRLSVERLTALRADWLSR